jgi:hypothetical protein
MNVDMIFAGYKYFWLTDIGHRGLEREYLSKRGAFCHPYHPWNFFPQPQYMCLRHFTFLQYSWHHKASHTAASGRNIKCRHHMHGHMARLRERQHWTYNSTQYITMNLLIRHLKESVLEYSSLKINMQLKYFSHRDATDISINFTANDPLEYCLCPDLSAPKFLKVKQKKKIYISCINLLDSLKIEQTPINILYIFYMLMLRARGSIVG